MVAIPSASLKIFTYWEQSKRLSAREVEVEERLINSCLANWRLVNQDREVVVITPDNVGQHVKKPLPTNWDLLAATVRSVFVRVNVIREQGGWWMDASALHFRPLDAATVTDPMADWCGCHLDKQHLNRPVDWFFFRPAPEVEMGEAGEKSVEGYTSQLLFDRWAEEVDRVLKWDPNEWATELRALYPHLTFHALPYYFDGWAMWKMFQQLLQEAGAVKKGEAHLDIPSNNGVFRVHTICNLEGAYSYLWEGGASGVPGYLAKFPESHESSRPLDPVTFGMLGGNDSTAEIVPVDDKNMIWKNLFQRDAEDFLEENPNAFCAKFTNVHRGMLLGLFDERKADEVNENSLVGKYVPGWRSLFCVHPAGVGGPTVTLNDGRKMPLVGLGTWKSNVGEVAAAVKAAVKCGYRHIDCAAAYGNEEEIGSALAELFVAGVVKREDLWITSKLFNDMHSPDDVPRACEKSLADLKLDYLDLYLIHWPVVSGCTGDILKPSTEETWRAMEELQAMGKVKSIGVSNFTVRKLTDMKSYAMTFPAVNQVELHPMWRQDALLAACAELGTHLTAYSPLGSPDSESIFNHSGSCLTADPIVTGVADEVGKTPVQALIRWAMQRGTSVIPKSAKTERVVDNFAVMDWALSEAQMTRLSLIEPQTRLLAGHCWLSSDGPYKSLAALWDEE